MSALESNCTLLIHNESDGTYTESALQEMLENKDEKVKIEGMKQLILLTINGQPMPKLLMGVIKYCLHTEHHIIKKLLLTYWEVVEKYSSDGKLLHEMILVCNAMKNNLQHPNEYIRGATLRFMTHIKAAEILESLIPSITANLEHRHSYVRKNAVLTVYTVYKAHPDLIPDGPELVDALLMKETNAACKRNAFLMLIECDVDRAVSYVAANIQSLTSQSESLQLLVLELIKKVCRTNSNAKSQFISVIFGLVNCPSNAVSFEAANTLVTLSAAPTAVRAAVTAYCQLLSTESDNNIKLIILGRLASLRRRSEKILQEMLMDVLRALNSPSIDIRKKTLDLAMDLVTPVNVEDVVGLLKKEIVKTDSKADVYRKLLVDAMRKCAVKFPDVVTSVIHLLMNYLGDDDNNGGLEVIYFVREIVSEYPQLKNDVLTKLVQNFDQIQSSMVFRVTLWIFGEYIDGDLCESTVAHLKDALAPLPLIKSKKMAEPAEGEAAAGSAPQAGGAPVVLSDGTYASTSAVEEKAVADDGEIGSSLRKAIVDGDYFLAVAYGSAITKIALKVLKSKNGPAVNEMTSEVMLALVSILRLGHHPDAAKPIDADAQLHLLLCIRVLLAPEHLGAGFAANSREAFDKMLEAERKKGKSTDEKKEIEKLTEADDLISIQQLKNTGGDVFFDDGVSDLNAAVGLSKSADKSKLSRIYQLTGFADPVYAEAELTVLEYDIVLDILVINQTDTTMQNLAVEISTSGDLKVVERPATTTLAPYASTRVRTSIKVTSTESGIIFGNIVYDSSSGQNQKVVIINNINIDVMDYIFPATCSDTAFRSMWAEFEWENKVAVNTDIAGNLNEYLEHILKITNMACMTPQAIMSGSCKFLAANLYARSIFGEDALLNLSVEAQEGGKISGYIRIRSKTQGIALSLGDKITSQQRKLTK